MSITKAEMERQEARHKKDMENPYYRKGFEAQNRDDCPYEMDNELCEKRSAIALKSGPLTEEEKKELKALGEEFFQTPWEQWIHGFYYNQNRDFLLDFTD
jgi:hypothetical protein